MKLTTTLHSLLVEYAEYASTGDDSRFDALGKILSELSVLASESELSRIKRLLLLGKELSVEQLEYYIQNPDEEIPTLQSTTSDVVVNTPASQRISYHDVLKDAKTRVLTLSESADIDEMTVIGGKFAESEYNGQLERYLLSVLILDAEANTKRLRTLRRFTSAGSDEVLSLLRAEFGPFIVKT